MTEKNSRGFNIWKPVVTERLESITFRESSAVGLNTWIGIENAIDLNDAVVFGHRYTHDKKGVDKAKENGLKYREVHIHMNIKELIELNSRIAEIIKYQLQERSKWYEEDQYNLPKKKFDNYKLINLIIEYAKTMELDSEGEKT